MSVGHLRVRNSTFSSELFSVLLSDIILYTQPSGGTTLKNKGIVVTSKEASSRKKRTDAGNQGHLWDRKANPNAQPRELEDTHVIVCGQGGGWLWLESGGDTDRLRHREVSKPLSKTRDPAPSALSGVLLRASLGIALDCSPLGICTACAPVLPITLWW